MFLFAIWCLVSSPSNTVETPSKMHCSQSIVMAILWLWIYYYYVRFTAIFEFFVILGP